MSNDDFQFVILYPSQPVAEVVSMLTYVNKAGVNLTGPYTIHVINQRGEWKADGSMPGDRRQHLNDPFTGIDGQQHIRVADALSHSRGKGNSRVSSHKLSGVPAASEAHRISRSLRTKTQRRA